MDKKVSLVVPEVYQNNRFFDEKNVVLNRDDCLRPYIELKDFLMRNNITISTCDIIRPSSADLVIFMDIPSGSDPWLAESLFHKKPLMAIALESKLHCWENLNQELHGHFDKIFIYRDDLIDDKKYIKVNYSFKFPEYVNVVYEHKEKFCTMISANKSANHTDEIYSERIKAVRWFENNHPDDFDLYGIGWDNLHVFKTRWISRVLNRLEPLRMLWSEKYPSYRGAIETKLPVLKKYKFSICYENTINDPGYITEKIFDSIFAGCVPIYLGAPNITEFIPDGCFIDKRRFLNYEELYAYMIGLDKQKYMQFIYNINEYINSEQKYFFTVDCFISTIYDSIKEKIF